MSTDKGGPAFPQLTNAFGCTTSEDGMTLRDYFAGQAITGTCPGGAISEADVAKYAAWAYRMADAMLAERSK